jgi:hypothetical protein
MPVTYDSIATTTISSPTPTITFSNLPQTYTDLVFVLHGRSGGSSQFIMRFNSDTATNYSWTSLYGAGGNPNSDRVTSASFIRIDTVGSLAFGPAGLAIINLPSYTNAVRKTALFSFANITASSSGISFGTGLYRSTSAITTVSLINNLDNWEPGTVATVYGILRA